MVNITIDTEGMDDILDRLDPSHVGEATRAMVTGLARLLLRYADMDAPVETGNLRRSGFMRVEEGGQSAIVAFGTKYAGVVEGGSAAHEISAVNAATLAFIPTSFGSLADAQASLTASRKTGAVKSTARAQGLAVFPIHVFHPGTTANPFMATGWEDASPEASLFISEVGQRWMTGDTQVEAD